MRYLMMVKASKDSEAGVLPGEKLLSEMGKYNETLVKAGALLAPRVSYAGVGRQTAALLQAVLSGHRPDEPIQPPQMLGVAVNAHVLKLLNQSVSASSGQTVSLIDEQ